MIDIEVPREAVSCPHAVQSGATFTYASTHPADEPRVVFGLPVAGMGRSVITFGLSQTYQSATPGMRGPVWPEALAVPAR